jgi:hypothetical protein
MVFSLSWGHKRSTLDGIVFYFFTGPFTLSGHFILAVFLNAFFWATASFLLVVLGRRARAAL